MVRDGHQAVVERISRQLGLLFVAQEGGKRVVGPPSSQIITRDKKTTLGLPSSFVRTKPRRRRAFNVYWIGRNDVFEHVRSIVIIMMLIDGWSRAQNPSQQDGTIPIPPHPYASEWVRHSLYVSHNNRSAMRCIAEEVLHQFWPRYCDIIFWHIRVVHTIRL